MHKLLLAGALAAGMVPATADAALLIDIGSVLVGGTETRTQVSYSCTSSCPTTVSYYEAIVGRGYGTTTVDQLPFSGPLTFTFQDGPRRYSDVTLVFADGRLLSSLLTGGEQTSRCITIPCIDGIARFGAISFAVTVTDQATGVSRVLAPVPEPASWLMMLIGFAGIGRALRRRSDGRRSAAA